MTRSIHHINLAVADLPSAAQQFAAVLGAAVPEIEVLAEREVQLCRFQLDAQWLILVAPTADSSPVARWLRENGPGLFLLSFEADDLDAALAGLAKDGIMPSGDVREGLDGWRVVDIDATATAGIPLHLTEESKV
ncbi:MAG: VOC family protein [Pseudomonadota bacterium]